MKVNLLIDTTRMFRLHYVEDELQEKSEQIEIERDEARELTLGLYVERTAERMM